LYLSFISAGALPNKVIFPAFVESKPSINLISVDLHDQFGKTSTKYFVCLCNLSAFQPRLKIRKVLFHNHHEGSALLQFLFADVMRSVKKEELSSGFARERIGYTRSDQLFVKDILQLQLLQQLADFN
jgi:hypothetical protein